MNKVLFLDIDGVLNSHFWNNSHQREISDGTLIDEEKIKIKGLRKGTTTLKVKVNKVITLSLKVTVS